MIFITTVVFVAGFGCAGFTIISDTDGKRVVCASMVCRTFFERVGGPAVKRYRIEACFATISM
jgi:hypothetical protein